MRHKTSLNLDIFKKPFDFPTHPEDGIKAVKIIMMRLKPYNGECDITLKVPDISTKTIHELAERWISFENSEIIAILTIREIGILIEFHDDKNINFRVKSDGNYFMDNPAEQESLDGLGLIKKYLNYWQLIL